MCNPSIIAIDTSAAIHAALMQRLNDKAEAIREAAESARARGARKEAERLTERWLLLDELNGTVNTVLLELGRAARSQLLTALVEAWPRHEPDPDAGPVALNFDGIADAYDFHDEDSDNEDCADEMDDAAD